MVKRKYFSRGFSNAKKCVYKGIKFDSQLERDRYIYLKSLEDKGLIKQLKIQVAFDILDSQSLKGQGVNNQCNKQKLHEDRPRFRTGALGFICAST